MNNVANNLIYCAKNLLPLIASIATTGINLVQNKDRARRQSRPLGHEGHAASAEEDGGEGAELEPDAALQPGPHEVGCEELHQRHVVEQPCGGGVEQADHDERGGAVLPVHPGERQPQRDPERRRRREEEHQPGPHLEAVLRLQDAAAEPHPLEQLVEAHGRHQRPDRAHALRRAHAQPDHHRVHDDAHLKDLHALALLMSIVRFNFDQPRTQIPPSYCVLLADTRERVKLHAFS